MTSKTKRHLSRLGLILALLTVASTAYAPTALAEVSLQVESGSNTTVDPHGQVALATTTPGSASPATNEVQRLKIDAGGGQFRLSFGPDTTPDLPAGASAGAVQAALEALPSIGTGNVAVAPVGFPISTAPPYLISFQNALAATDVPQLTASEGTQPLAGRLKYGVALRTSATRIPTAPKCASRSPCPRASPASASTLRSSPMPAPLDCPGVAGAQVITCTGEPFFQQRGGGNGISLTVGVDPAAAGVLTAAFELEGGGATQAARTVDPVTVTPAAPPFGIDAFDLTATRGGAASTQAAGHPDAQTTAIDYNIRTDPSPVVGEGAPVEDPRDVVVDLPAGFVGNPAAVSYCGLAQLGNGGFVPRSLCSPSSQVGTVRVRTFGSTLSVVPLFNMEPPPTAPARLGFNVSGNIVVLDAHPRAEGDYGITVGAVNVPQGLQISGQTVTFWGIPSAPGHDPERNCPGEKIVWEGGTPVTAPRPPRPSSATPPPAPGPRRCARPCASTPGRTPASSSKRSPPPMGRRATPIPPAPPPSPPATPAPNRGGRTSAPTAAMRCPSNRRFTPSSAPTARTARPVSPSTSTCPRTAGTTRRPRKKRWNRSASPT